MADQQACYAAYFNVARHNLLLTLNDIARKSGLSSIENEDQVANHPVLTQVQTWAKDPSFVGYSSGVAGVARLLNPPTASTVQTAAPV